MGVEELKLVLQTLAGLADGAKEGFIWWLIIEGAMPKILLALFGGGAISAVIYVARLIARDSMTEKHAVLGIKRISEDIGLSVYSMYLSESEVDMVVNAVRKLKERK